jgi:quercetin dioxygenase-like cupin family protein
MQTKATMQTDNTRRRSWRALFLGAAVVLAITGAARAGECPADRVIANGNVPNAATAPSGVTDTVLTAIDLAREPAAVQGRQLRLRRLVVQPGGVVPWHSHGNRPAIIYVVEGEIVEYASTCAVPIVHRAGESTAERAAISHWWKNTSDRPVVLLSADLFPTSDDAHVM